MIHLLLLLTLLNPTDPGADCKADVAKAYERLKVAYSAEPRRISLQYNLRTEDHMQTVSEESVSMVVKGDRSMVTSAKVLILQDKDTYVGINKESKQILITKPGNSGYSAAQLESALLLFDTLFHRLEQVSCERNCKDDKSSQLLQKIKFGLAGAAGMTLTYWLSEPAGDIKRIIMEQSEGGMLRSVDFRLIGLDTKYNGSVFEGSAIRQVLDGQGKALKAYRDFKLIDLRK